MSRAQRIRAAIARLDARGRPRQSGARDRSGRLIRVSAQDEGTPELRAKRAGLAGENGDPRMTTMTIDVLRTRGLISNFQWEAALRFLKVRRGYPWPHARCVRVEGASGTTHESSAEAAAARLYHGACMELMRQVSPACASAVYNTIVTGQWGLKELAGEGVLQVTRLTRLRAGIDVLAGYFGAPKRRS